MGRGNSSFLQVNPVNKVEGTGEIEKSPLGRPRNNNCWQDPPMGAKISGEV